MWDTYTTMVGRIAADPEIQTAKTGTQYCRIKIIHTARKYDKDSKTWIDGDETVLPATLFGEFASHVADSLTAGTRVIACGRLRENRWQDNDGNRKSQMQLEIEEIGPSLRFDTATVHRSGGKRDQGDTRAPRRAQRPTPVNDEPPF